MKPSNVLEISSGAGPLLESEELKLLKPKEIMAINMKFQGKSNPEISKMLNVTPNTVSTWFCKQGKLRKAYEARCRELLAPSVHPAVSTDSALSVAERLKAEAPAALSTIVELSRGAKREQVRYQSSADILDRAGYAPVQKNLNVDMVGEMTMQELDALVLGIVSETEAKPIAQRGNVIDADAVADALMGTPDNVPNVDEEKIIDSLF